MATNGKQKIHLTLNPETANWLKNQYPESDSMPEAVRAAVGDAKRFWDMVEVEVDHR